MHKNNYLTFLPLPGAELGYSTGHASLREVDLSCTLLNQDCNISLLPLTLNENCDELTGPYTGGLSLNCDFQNITVLAQANQTLHTKVHNFVGGAFSTHWSPTVPLFWTWHAYFDEWWQNWECCRSGGNGPLGGRPDYYIKDSPSLIAGTGGGIGGIYGNLMYDVGHEESQYNGDYPTWVSEYIWVRNQDDGFTNQTHQNIRSNETNYIYVKVRNRGCVASSSTAGDELELRWSLSTLNASQWPDDWNGVNDYPGTNNPMGGLVDNLSMTQVIQVADFKVYEFEWNTPNFANYLKPIKNHNQPTLSIAFLARVLSEADPDKVSSTVAWIYVRDNNNVARRNAGKIPINIYSTTPNIPSDPCCFQMNGDRSGDTVTVSLKIDAPQDEWSDHYFNHGKLFITLDDSLYAVWAAGGKQGTGITDMGNPVRINTTGARLDNLTIGGLDMYMICPYGVVQDWVRDTDERMEFRIDIIQVNNTTDTLEGIRLFADLEEPVELREDLSERLQTVTNTSNTFNVYPNPALDQIHWSQDLTNPVLQIRILDPAGQFVAEYQGGEGSVSIRQLNQGFYFIQARLADGSMKVTKFVKQ